MRYGRWTFIAKAGKMPLRASLWLCRCDCGTERVVMAAHLRDGSSQSCGCLRQERSRGNRYGVSHGQSNTPTWRTWKSMHERCRRDPAYGGISVCDAWADFATFLADMGERPSAKHSIDRWPNQRGNYEPGNCRWATSSEQSRNRKDNRLITIGTETKCLVEWVNESGPKYPTVFWRIQSRGIDPAVALGIR